MAARCARRLDQSIQSPELRSSLCEHEQQSAVWHQCLKSGEPANAPRPETSVLIGRKSRGNSCSTLVNGSGCPLERAVAQLVAPGVLRLDRRTWLTAASATAPPCSFARSHERPDRAGTASARPRRRSSFCRYSSVNTSRGVRISSSGYPSRRLTEL